METYRVVLCGAYGPEASQCGLIPAFCMVEVVADMRSNVLSVEMEAALEVDSIFYQKSFEVADLVICNVLDVVSGKISSTLDMG